MRNAPRPGNLNYKGTMFNFDEFYRQHYQGTIRAGRARRQEKEMDMERKEEKDRVTFWFMVLTCAAFLWKFG